MGVSATNFAAYRGSVASGCNPGPPPQGRASLVEEEEKEKEKEGERERELGEKERDWIFNMWKYNRWHVAENLNLGMCRPTC